MRRDERAKMRATKEWPMHVLPVKRRKGSGLPELGAILASDVEAEGAIRVFGGNICDGPDTVVHTFPSIDALIDAGWVGD